MSEENGKHVEAPDDANGISTSEVRNHDFFKNVMREKDTELGGALDQLNELRSRLDADAKQKEIQEKEAAGEYQQVRAQLEADNALMKKSYEAKITKLQLENELTREGADEYFTSWAIQKYNGTDIGEYVESLKTDDKHSQRFNIQQQSEQNPTPMGAVPAARSPGNWAQTRQDLQSRDPQVRDNADLQVLAYMEKHGKLPW